MKKQLDIVITSDIRNSLAHAVCYYIEHLEQKESVAATEIIEDYQQAITDAKKAQKWLENIVLTWYREDQQI